MKTKLANHLKAGFAGLYIQSPENQRVEGEVAAAAAAAGFEMYTWTATRGVVHIKPGPPPEATMLGQNPDLPPHYEALEKFDNLPKDQKAVLLLHDMHMFFAQPDPIFIRKIKDSLLAGKMCNHSLIILGCVLTLPPELEKEIAVIEFKLPDREQLLTIATNIAKSAGVVLNGGTDALLDAASGLTCMEAEDAMALAVIETKDLTPAVVSRVKAETIKKNGLLEIMETNVGLEDIGGLEVLKDWLTKRRHAFSPNARAYGLPLPRGYLMVGIPGCSKTLAAKATAKILGVPLLKLDGGKLFAGLVGASEANIRSVIQTCEAIAPCVVLCDEIEKSFAGSKSSGSTDGGTSARVLGTFLQWMNDKTAPVFVVATANDITQLPPEFLRKGRFDQLFFNDLPTEDEREDIWAIQIRKHGRKSKDFDLKVLAKATPDWTGAEIESLFRESLFSAFDKGTEPTTELLLELAKESVPLSKTMAAQVQGLREWAKGKAVRSSKPVAYTTAAGQSIAS